MLTADFSYDLPSASIAQAAIEPRHDARVLVTSNLAEIKFLNIADLLLPGDLLVVNRTRVRAARLMGIRPSGGKAEFLITKRVDPARWQALVRPSKKLPAGSVVSCGEISVEVLTDPIAGVASVTLSCDGDIEDAIARVGSVPLPPYFHGELASADRYQTMFATTVGSSAAPTAALHFTDQVVDRLSERSVEVAEVDLEVGLDTFRPMDDGQVVDHVMHAERVVVDADVVAAVDRTRARGGRVIAVGTTVVRSLESASVGRSGRIAEFDGDTRLFITPGYQFRTVDAMFTNFHAPRTTLVVMIAAILGDKWRDVYLHALTSGFRFLSFGDSMFIEIDRDHGPDASCQ